MPQKGHFIRIKWPILTKFRKIFKIEKIIFFLNILTVKAPPRFAAVFRFALFTVSSSFRLALAVCSCSWGAVATAYG